MVLRDRAPAGLVPWIREQKDIDWPQYLIYKAGWATEPITGQKTPCADAACTACGAKMKLDRAYSAKCQRGNASFGVGWVTPPPPKAAPPLAGEAKMSGYEKYGSGENGFCPECGAKVTVLHSSCVNKLVSYVWPMSFERAGYDLICYLWRVERWVEKDGSIGLYASPWEAYVFGEKTAAVYKRWENGFFGTYYVSDAWKKLQKFEDRAYDIDLVYNPEGIEQATRGTWAENSKLEIYMGVESEYRFPIAWLKLDQAARTEKTLKEQIRELETRPQPVAVQRDEKAIEEAVQKAKAAAAAEWSEKTKKLTDKLNEANAKAEKLKAKVDKASAGADEKLAAAERETARIRQELEAAQKKLKASNGNVAAFGVYFKSVQENFNSMMEKVREIGEEDQETAKKLCGAARVILNKAIERLGEG